MQWHVKHINETELFYIKINEWEKVNKCLM